jgi:hypothetical protein
MANIVVDNELFNKFAAHFIHMYNYEGLDVPNSKYESECKLGTDNVTSVLQFIADNRNKKNIILSKNTVSTIDNAFGDLFNYIKSNYYIEIGLFIHIPDPIKTFTKPEYVGNIRTLLKDGISPLEIYWPGFSYFDSDGGVGYYVVSKNEINAFNFVAIASDNKYTYNNITYNMSDEGAYCLYVKFDIISMINAMKLVTSMKNNGRMQSCCSLTIDETEI